jgi:ribosomal protein S12 methylthiotransferase
LIRFFLDQHGCAKNQVDGELLIAQLEGAGYEQVQYPADADLIVVNSCGFIEEAKKESLNSLLQARASFPNAKLLLAGCLAQRYADVFADALPEADGIFGNGDLSMIGQAAELLFQGERPVIVPAAGKIMSVERTELLSLPGTAYVKITEGCDNRCSFCAIPLIRGPLRSRPVAEIVDEIQALLKRGIFEINLVAQDLAAFGTDAPGNSSNSALASLLGAISTLKGDFWLRMLYIHPDHFPLDILDCIKSDRRILPYFDIPFQSGSDRIIREMNRKKTAAEYVNLVERIRADLGDGGITPVFRTTFLAGFPGETDEDAELTGQFLQTIRPAWSGVFSYSREEGTPASKLKPQVPKKIAKTRVKQPEAIQAQITRESLTAYTGRCEEVIVEEVIAPPSEAENEGYAIARAWFQAPEVDGSVIVRYDSADSPARDAVLPGKHVRVKITGSSDVDLDSMLDT